jgi:hypothetical protein
MENIWGDGTTGAPNLQASSGHLGRDTSPAPPTGEEEEEDTATGVDETCLDREDSMDVSGDEDNIKDSSVDLTVPPAGIKSQHGLTKEGGGGKPVKGKASDCAKTNITASHSGSTGGGEGTGAPSIVKSGKKWVKKRNNWPSNRSTTRSKQQGKGKKGNSSWAQ